MVRRLKWLAPLFAALVASGPVVADEPATARQVRVLILLPDEHKPLDVRLIKTSDYVRGFVFTGAIPAVIGAAIVEHRNNPLEATFAGTMAGFERNAALLAALSQSFRQRDSGRGVFEIASSTDNAKYLQTKGVNHLTGSAGSEGFDYVLVLESSFTGLRTRDAAEAAREFVAATTDLWFALYRVKDGKLAQRGSVSSSAVEGRHYRAAIGDRQYFEVHWPLLCKVIAGNLTGALNRTDQLHLMAAAVGRGDDVPAVQKLLDRESKKFKWDLEPVEGWRETKLNTPWARVLEPKDASRTYMGLRFDVDLLVAEFGQDVDTIEEYIEVYARRRAEAAPQYGPLQEFTDITAPGFRAYSSRSDNGAYEVVMVKKLDDKRVEIAVAVFLKDFQTLYPANRAKIEKMIATSSVRLL